MSIVHRSAGLLWIATILATAIGALRAEPEPDQPTVIVVANRQSQDSLSLARYYREARNIPETAQINLDCSPRETISWQHFTDRIHNPLLEALVAGGWISTAPISSEDSHGRLPVRVTESRIDFLVLMHGIPLRIENNQNLAEGRTDIPNPFRTSRAAVDSELATLPATSSPLVGVVENPFFQKREPSQATRQQALRVTRLDGPTPHSVRRMIDNALEAEEKGLRGRAYIDQGGPHAIGEKWLEQTYLLLNHLSFDTVRETSKSRFQLTDRFDAPVFYFGWYAPHLEGPFQLPGFSFAPGAVGFHIHSASAQSLRNEERRWAGPLIARGITATVGNVYEPYLEFSHHPHLLVAGLDAGMRWAEAAYFSLPVLSWQSVAIGDPLYRPFLKRLPDQVRRGPIPGDALAQYSMIRTFNRLEAAQQLEQARELGMQWFHQQPGIALGLRLLSSYQEEENTEAEQPRFLLDVLSLVRRYEAREIGLGLHAAGVLEQYEKSRDALELLQSLHRLDDLPDPIRLEIEKRGRALATRMGPGVYWED